jgi:hypothetical protein
VGSEVCRQKRFFELFVNLNRLEGGMPPIDRKGVSPLRRFAPVVVLVLMLATDSLAAPVAAKSSVFPEPGLLALLGGGLVGLATLIRRHLGD